MAEAVPTTPKPRRGRASSNVVPLPQNPAPTWPIPSAVPKPDAELIQRSRQLAERDLDSFYRYVIAPDGLEDDNELPDWETFNFVLHTPLGRQKVGTLALSAWNRDLFDERDDSDPSRRLLASLLCDMVGPERHAIIARLALKYGPLPKNYTPEGIWTGSERDQVPSAQGDKS